MVPLETSEFVPTRDPLNATGEKDGSQCLTHHPPVLRVFKSGPHALVARG